jgi:hypothetical protein
MRSIMMTYPGFHALPRGVKRMLVESENLFFAEAKSTTDRLIHALEHASAPVSEHVWMQNLLPTPPPGWRGMAQPRA